MVEHGPPTEQGKLWAILSYAGFFVGLPLALVPLIARDDPYALRHAKTATAVWLGAFALSIALVMLYAVISVVTCGIGAVLFPMLFLPAPWAVIVAIHGLVLALNGAWEEPIGGFGLGETLFGSIDVKPDRRLPPTL
jgi:uncharacterized protein